LVRKEGSINLFERWLTYPESNPPLQARELKSEFYFNNTHFAGLQLLRNERKIFEWQSHVSEFKVFPAADTTTWHEYSYHDIPWPVSDQDHFMVYRVRAKSNRVLTVAFESTVNETLAPVRKGVSRMQLSGSWTFEQINPNRVKVTYRILSKPIGIPKVFTDPIIRSNIMTTIEEYIRLLERQ
jgi:hypothetical protein